MEEYLPPAARYAFDESDDEEEEALSKSQESQVKVTVNLDRRDATVLIVGLNKSPSTGPGYAFLKSLTTEGEKVGKVICERPEKPTEEIPIFELGNVSYIPFDKPVADEDAPALTKAILAGFTEVIVLDSFSASRYITNTLTHRNPPFLRVLQNSHAKLIPDFVRYDSPNIIKGFAASLTAHCEIYAIPCNLLLTMQESWLGKDLVTIETLQAYVLGLHSLGIEMAIDETKMKSIKGGRVDNNHHYVYL